MILTIHNLAETYKCLPTEILARASTFDLYVLDVHTRWLKYQHQRSENERSNPNAPRAPVMSVEQMKQMIAKAKGNV